MPLLVTSAADANGNGYGALLTFDRDGGPLGPIRAASPSIATKGCFFSTTAPKGCWRSTGTGESSATAGGVKD